MELVVSKYRTCRLWGSPPTIPLLPPERGTMACSATSIALSSSLNPKMFTVSSRFSPSMASLEVSKTCSKTLTLSTSFTGVQLPRAHSSGFSRSSRRRFLVRASEVPLVGNVAPDFEAEAVFDQEFINVKLSDYRGKKYVILFFYPLDFTFVCPTEITAFSDRYPEFEKLNTEILGVSIDSVFSHLAWVQTDRKSGDPTYPLISDVTKSISKSYNVLIPDQALQYVQENPDEVCPAGWKPGEKSMKPNPKLSKEYFAAI